MLYLDLIDQLFLEIYEFLDILKKIILVIFSYMLFYD